MKIQCHDAHYSLDYVSWVNAVFDMTVDHFGMKFFNETRWGISAGVFAKFFRYENVSLPTMLQIEAGSGVRILAFCVKID